MSKKITAIFMAAITLISACFASTSYNENSAEFTDISDHWAKDDIVTLNRLGIFKGTNGKANPNLQITRGEFTALIARALGLEGKNYNIFNDVNEDNIFFSEISAAYSAGLINGNGNGDFCSEDKITREEIMLIVSRCVNVKTTDTSTFKDISKNYKYIAELKNAVSAGIITGYSDGTFKPLSNATRAEAAAMTVRLLKNSVSPSDSNLKKFAKNYIKNDIENPQNNTQCSIGNALNEISCRNEYIEEIQKYIPDISKTIGNLSVESVQKSGMLSVVTLNADISYAADKYSRVRNADIILKIFSKSNSLYTYEYNINFNYTEKINLTWDVYSTIPSYSPKGVNIISPSCFHISSDELGVEKNELADGISFYNSLTSSYVNYAKTNNYDIWAMYKTDFTLNTSDKFLNNANSKKKAISLLINYACKYNIAGINFDFENMYEKNRDVFSEHVRKVTLAMHEMGIFVSVDVTRKEKTSSVWSMCYDRAALSETADYIMLMAYDEYYADSKTPGSVASLDWTEDTIKKTLAEVPSKKLILGIPFYMRYWEVTNGKVTSTKAISMETAWTLANENNAEYTWIAQDEQYKVSWKKDNTTCSFWLENAQTIKKRVELSNKYSLAGIASWRRGLETDDVWKIIIDNLFI